MSDSEPSVGQTGDEIDTMPGPGRRSDHAGSSASMTGPAPNGGAAGDSDASSETRSNPHVPAGNATGASGGFGTGSERSSGGTGEGQISAGDDPETEWLREAPGTRQKR